MHVIAIFITGGVLLAGAQALLRWSQNQMNESEKFALRQEAEYMSTLPLEKAVAFWMSRHLAGVTVLCYLVFSVFIAPVTGLNDVAEQWHTSALESMTLLFYFPSFWCVSECITESPQTRKTIA